MNLSDLVTPHKASSPPQGPIVIERDGMRWEEKTCPRHGTTFLRVYVHRLQSTTGQCPNCAKEAAQEAQATRG
jgi:predicted RNA-binding Zn-ribbon protein involved in translation (DUF1610 family)